MAGKANVDDSVIERRLRPIYDWLDNGNNKKAVQEADKVLKKQPKLLCASVLKALALLRLGRKDDCLELIDTVVAEGTADDATLQALTICYREMHQPELICLIYEKASKLDPTNEDIMSHLFMAHVRVGDYKKQQQTAMQLYKLKPKNPYYFWAVMSIVMQAHVTKDAVARKVSLQLAERMILKLVNEDKIESEAEVLTYLYILEIQDKYSEALSVLDGPLARRVVQQQQNFLPMKRATAHTHMKHFDTASVIYMNLIRHELDNWQHYVHFTDTVLSSWLLARSDNNPAKRECPPDDEGGVGERGDPLLEASLFLKDTRDKTLANLGVERSPLLGLLQLALKLKENGVENKIEALCGDVTDQLYVYTKHYGDKMCCYGDIVNFVPLIPKADVTSLLARVEELVDADDEGLPKDIKNIYRHQLWLQLRRALGQDESLPPEKQLHLADRLASFYARTAHFSADMAPTDIRPNDTYLILCAHAYLAVLPSLSLRAASAANGAAKCGATASVTNVVIKLCSLLEHGIEVSKANFQLKLLLIKAYNRIGATSPSFSVYEKLDLKQIQMDTLGHVLAFQAMDTAAYSLAANIFAATLKFFMANYKDTSDPLIMSYKVGSLIRIPEFVEFRDRLNHSRHFAAVTAEQMVLELVTGANSRPELELKMSQLDIDPWSEETNWGDLTDNRDLQVMNTWEPQGGRLPPQLKEDTFRDDVQLLRIRNTTLRILAAAFNLRVGKSGTTVSDATLCGGGGGKKQKGGAPMLNGDATNGSSPLCRGGGGADDPPSFAVFKELVQTLEEHVEGCEEKYRRSKPPQIPLQGPDVPRIFLYSRGHHLEVILKHAQALARVFECTEGNEGMDSWSADVMKELSEVSAELCSFHLGQVESLQVTTCTALPGINSQPLNHLSHFIQTVSLVVILVECCHSLIAPIKTSIAKKNKKKKGNIPLPQIISHFNGYLSSLHSRLHQFETSFSDKLSFLKRHTDGETTSHFQGHHFDPIIPNLDHKPVCHNVHLGFSVSLINLNSVLKAKLKFLSSLKV